MESVNITMQICKMFRSVLVLLFTLFNVCTANEILAVRSTISDLYDDSANTLQQLTSRSLISCLSKCRLYSRCSSLFYNNMTTRCLLHEDPFIYSTPTNNGPGWRHYVIVDHRGYCPSENGFLYYRELDICYNINGPNATNFTSFKETCNAYSAQLLRIDSIRRQKYIELVMKSLPPTIYFCIQGTDTIDPQGNWTFDDGTIMPYLNWYTVSNEPKSGQGNIAMNSGRKFRWFSRYSVMTDQCIYACEMLRP